MISAFEAGHLSMLAIVKLLAFDSFPDCSKIA